MELATNNKNDAPQLITFKSVVKGSQTIAHVITAEPPIKNLNDPENNSLRVAFKKVFIMLGIKAADIPQDIERDILIDLVKKYFGLLNCKEIELAFELATTSQLIGNDNKIINVKLWGNAFSFDQVSTILTAYIEQKRRQVLHEINKNQMQSEQTEQKTTPEIEAIHKDFLATCILKPIQDAENGEFPNFTISIEKVFKALVKYKIIVMTDQDKKTLKQAKTDQLNDTMKMDAILIPLYPEDSKKKKAAILYLKGENQIYFDNLLQNNCRREAIETAISSQNLEEIKNKLS